MNDPTSPPLTLPELERILKDAEDSAFLVPRRILRRVIKEDRGLRWFGGHAAHRASYVISGRALRTIVMEEELGLAPGESWPETALLFERPEPEWIAAQPRAEVLLGFWRKLFHARVEAEIDLRLATGALDDRAVQDRIGRIGAVEFDEIRSVLLQDGWLLPPRDDRMVYREFAAVFLELVHFAPALLPHDFPALESPGAIAEVLADDVAAGVLVAATRLAGAAPPSTAPISDEEIDEQADEDDGPALLASEATEGIDRWLIHQAEHAAARGNLVRAAILWTQAAHRDGPASSRRGRTGARAELERLARRLQQALGFDDAELDRWRRALPALLERSARGFWMPEARLLYDLQKVCDDHERAVYTVDLVEWMRSLGRRPLKRPQPHLREVMIANHLKRAARRLPSARLTRDARDRLSQLLHLAVQQAEETTRARFRPTIDATLTREGLRPRNLPERVAYAKLIEVLLDKVVDRGFLTLGTLRDACSRSNLKLPDLSGPREFFQGDQLLRIDHALGEDLDGVYRRGEIYLRLLQRMSALGFATPWGRFLTRFLVLPFGGAFVVLEGIKHLVKMVTGVGVGFAGPGSVLAVGAAAVGVLNFPGFRHHFVADVRAIGRGLRAVFVDLPARLLRLPIVRQVIESRLFTAVWRFALKPVLVIAPFWALGSAAGLEWRGTLPTSAVAFASISLLINSRVGRVAEEIATDSASRLWRRFWFDLVPGLFRWVLLVFQRLVESVERLIYAVDEWLRFRQGQRRGSLVLKAVLGFVWFFVAYIVRIYVNLLIEPQVNPIKHFPVVTVSHKVILPIYFKLFWLIAIPMTPIMGPEAAKVFAGTTVFLLPGVFGFLVWEFKENWKLYEANRPEALPAVIVGDHGETLRRLLRPGFHSGTVPKLFAKVRKSERRVLEGGASRSMHRNREALHHVEEEVRRFLDRDLIALMRGSRLLGPLEMSLGAIELATNRIRVEFEAEQEPSGQLWIEFVEQARVLRAGELRRGPLPELSPSQRRALRLAIWGLFQMSAVERVGGPIRELADGAESDSESESESASDGRPRSVITWRYWVESWEQSPHDEPDRLPSALEQEA